MFLKERKNYDNYKAKSLFERACKRFARPLSAWKKRYYREFIASLDEALDKKELIKVSVLKNVFMSTREAMDAICEELNCEPVSCVGSKMVFYRRAKDEKNVKIIL